MEIEKINILFHSKFPHARMGGQKSLLALIDNLDITNFKAFLTMPADGELRILAEKRGIEVLIKPMPVMTLKNIFKLVKIRKEFVDFIKENNIKIIHTDDDKFAFFSTFIAKNSSVKTIYHSRVALKHKYDKLLEARVDIIVGISNAVLNRFDRQKYEDKLRKIYNGVDCEIFHNHYTKEEIQAILGFEKNQLNLIFVGQLKVSKGLDDLIKAATILKEEMNSNFKIYILGEEIEQGMKDYFLSSVENLNLTKNIVFCGQQNNVEKWLQASDILLFPSHEGAEGMGRVPFEAMATATPTIASNISGVNEAVTNEVGILIEEKSPKQLADAILSLANNKELYSHLSINGRKRALEVFDIKIHAQNMMNLFQEMVR